MDDFRSFLARYSGAIIGALIAIVALILQVYKVIIGILVIGLGMFIGNYVQYNKETVKEKLKNIIDRL